MTLRTYDLMVKETAFKYNEAAYFLQQMKQTKDDFATFAYNVSAFVSAARSVTLVMQTENSNHPKFSEWYDKKKVEMSKDEDFRFFNDQRRQTIHMRSIRPHMVLKMGPFTTSKNGVIDIPIGIVGEKGQILRSDEWITIDGVPHPEIERPPISSYCVFADRPDVDAIDLCEKYILKLRAMVMELHDLAKTQPNITKS